MTIQLYDLVGSDTSRPFSPHCWKVKMALAHKGLAFETIPQGFLDVPKIENELGKIIPVLRDGDNVINDSFRIALYLEENYPDKPSLFGGPGGIAHAKFIESWSQMTLHPKFAVLAVEEISEMLEGADKDYFIASREKMFKKSLAQVSEGKDNVVEGFPELVKPLRHMLKSQPFIGGESPLFADYIVFGAMQWSRICSATTFLPEDDEVMVWFNKILDLHDGLGRTVSAACDN
ncbi:MAG: glutathione S-transferase family protein [Rhizobiaceae bacterium]|nr:glutathione S-transferase family protein [Rhizobiaceae bacterium]